MWSTELNQSIMGKMLTGFTCCMISSGACPDLSMSRKTRLTRSKCTPPVMDTLRSSIPLAQRKKDWYARLCLLNHKWCGSTRSLFVGHLVLFVPQGIRSNLIFWLRAYMPSMITTLDLGTSWSRKPTRLLSLKEYMGTYMMLLYSWISCHW